MRGRANSSLSPWNHASCLGKSHSCVHISAFYTGLKQHLNELDFPDHTDTPLTQHTGLSSCDAVSVCGARPICMLRKHLGLTDFMSGILYPVFLLLNAASFPYFCLPFLLPTELPLHPQILSALHPHSWFYMKD